MKQNVSILFLILFCSFFVSSQEPLYPCSSPIEISSSPEIVDTGKEGIYTAKPYANLETRTAKYTWSVSGGKILEGQNTSSIKLLRENDSLGVSVEIQISPENCVVSLNWGHIIDKLNPVLINEYDSIAPGEEKRILDDFFNRLEKSSSDRGTIFVTDDKNLKLRLKFLINYIKRRKSDPSRITFLIGRNDNVKTLLYLLSPSAEKPDCQDCTEVKADDTKTLQNIFRLKLKT